MIRLIDLYPDHYINHTMEEILKAQDNQLEGLELGVESLVREFFIKSAVFSLPTWCKFAGIDYDSNLSIDILRSNILASLKARDTTTIEVVKNIVQSYSNGTCEVIEDYANYKFTIKFVSTVGVPKRIDEIRKIINKVKPAHLDYEFEFKYRAWDDIEAYGKTWNEWKSLGKTWKDLKEGEL